MEFPRTELIELARKMEAYASPYYRDDAALIRLGVQRFDEISLRVCEDNTKHSLTIAALRARISELENPT